MLVPSAFNVLEGLLERFRPCFFRPQFRNFSTYILGLVACEGRRNVGNINRHFMEARDQSTLNRFLTASPWSLQLLEAQRLKLMTERIEASPAIQDDDRRLILEFRDHGFAEGLSVERVEHYLHIMNKLAEWMKRRGVNLRDARKEDLVELVG